MTNFFIVSAIIFDTTDWQASPCCNVGPVKIYSGPHAGSYAVNTAILDTDPCFEKYRSLLEPCQKLNLSIELENPDTNV